MLPFCYFAAVKPNFPHLFRTLSLSKGPENAANILFSGCQARFTVRVADRKKRNVFLEKNVKNIVTY